MQRIAIFMYGIDDFKAAFDNTLNLNQVSCFGSVQHGFDN